MSLDDNTTKSCDANKVTFYLPLAFERCIILLGIWEKIFIPWQNFYSSSFTWVEHQVNKWSH